MDYDFSLLVHDGVCDFRFLSPPVHPPHFISSTHLLYDSTRYIVEYQMSSTSPIIRFALAFPATGKSTWSSSTLTWSIPVTAHITIADIIDPKWSQQQDQRSGDEKHMITTCLVLPDWKSNPNYQAITMVTLEHKESKNAVQKIRNMVRGCFPLQDRVAIYDMVVDTEPIDNIKPSEVLIFFGHGRIEETTVYSDVSDPKYKKFEVDVLMSFINAVQPKMVLMAVCYSARLLIPELQRRAPDVIFFGYQQYLWTKTVVEGSFMSFLTMLLTMLRADPDTNLALYRQFSFCISAHQQHSPTAISNMEATLLTALDLSRRQSHTSQGFQSNLSDMTLYNGKLLHHTINFGKLQGVHTQFNMAQPTDMSDQDCDTKEAAAPVPRSVYHDGYPQLLFVKNDPSFLKSHLQVQNKAAEKRYQQFLATPAPMRDA